MNCQLADAELAVKGTHARKVFPAPAVAGGEIKSKLPLQGELTDSSSPQDLQIAVWI